ncbi:MAG: hypothetical protein HPY74_03650 [Firmicutes bacterium]|nr:hypothetical protein [Bacillota bacterium]
MHEWDIQLQKSRRKQIYELYRKYMFDKIDDELNWHGKEREPGFREIMWHCLPLLDGDEHAITRANRIIEAVPLQVCHFTPMTSLQILLKYKDRLTKKAVEKLEGYVKNSLPGAASDKIHFTMYNDNFASMNTFTLLAAGEMFGDEEAFKTGMQKLNQLKEVLMRCGTIMEYGSPTYTPISTHALAEIVNYIEDHEAKNLARQCEERMWAEIATHYHAPTAHLAGPYSRAYMVDSVGHPHNLTALLYLVFGEKIFINPVTNMFPPHKQQVIHCGLETLMWPNLAWLCSGDCHCPDYLADILLNKAFPYNVITTSECLPSPEYIYEDCKIEYPAYSGPNTTYMTEDFAIGTAYSQFHDGAASESFYTVYRKKVPASHLEDIGVVFSRYIINEKIPGVENVYNGRVHGVESFRDEGRKFGLQYKDCAMVVYKPKHFEANNISSMKLSIIMPCHFNTIEEIWLGTDKLSSLEGESIKPCTIFVKDGPVYMAFKPLELTNHGRRATVKVEKVKNFIMISFYNYEGPAKSFDPKDIILTSAGFIAHIKSSSEFKDINRFVSFVEDSTLKDKITSQMGAYTRWVRYTRKDLDLHFAYSPISEGIMIATINGCPRPKSIFEATGLDSRVLPFLQENLLRS